MNVISDGSYEGMAAMYQSGDDEALFIPREGFAFYEESGGASTEGSIDWYFDDSHEKISEVEIGFDRPGES